MEGPIDPAELVEILQRTMEEQGSAFGSTARSGREEEQRIKEEEARKRARAKEDEKLRADRQLREEQDAAYFAALKIDQVCLPVSFDLFPMYFRFQVKFLSRKKLKFFWRIQINFVQLDTHI